MNMSDQWKQQDQEMKGKLDAIHNQGYAKFMAEATERGLALDSTVTPRDWNQMKVNELGR